MASVRLTNVKLVQAVVYSSFAAFMLGYHVHEKAILTALLPMTLLLEQTAHGSMHNVLFWNTALWGLLGLFPLFFSPVELAFKLFSYVTYLALCSYLLRTPPYWAERTAQLSAVMVAAVTCILEFLPIQGRWEFLPLLVTSIVCAHGLIGCWFISLMLLIQDDNEPDL